MHSYKDPAEPGLHEAGVAAMPPNALARYRSFMRNEAPAVEKEWLQVDNFKATIKPLDLSMLDKLHELTVSVFWPHRAPDLEMLLHLGHGYLAFDEIGRALSSAMCFQAGQDYAMCGMMVTTPRLQAQGTGARLLRRVMADCPGRDLRLSATRSGYRLYESAGFVPVGPISQHQGIARPVVAPAAVPGLSLRPFAPKDEASLRALDTHAYGAVRTRVMDILFSVSEVIVAERDGAVTGFAMLRKFGKGLVIGPLVTEDEAVAMHLAAAFIRPHTGQFLRVDTPMESDGFSSFLTAAGLGVYDTVTEMRLGQMRRAQSGPQSWGLATQSLG